MLGSTQRIAIRRRIPPSAAMKTKKYETREVPLSRFDRVSQILFFLLVTLLGAFTVVASLIQSAWVSAALGFPIFALGVIGSSRQWKKRTESELTEKGRAEQLQDAQQLDAQRELSRRLFAKRVEDAFTSLLWLAVTVTAATYGAQEIEDFFTNTVRSYSAVCIAPQGSTYCTWVAGPVTIFTVLLTVS